MNYKKIYIPLLLSILILLPGCEKENSEIDAPQYMLHCLMIEGRAPIINIGRTLSTYPAYPFDIHYYEPLDIGSQWDNSNNKLILRSQNEVIETFTKKEFDVYTGDSEWGISKTPLGYETSSYLTNDQIHIQPNDEYEINLDIYDYNQEKVESLSAHTSIPAKVPFEITRLEGTNTGTYSQETKNVFQFTFTDQPGDDYYYFLPYIVYWRSEEEFSAEHLDSMWLPEKNQFNYYDYDGDIRFKDRFSSNMTITGLGDQSDQHEDPLGILLDDRSFEGMNKEFAIQVSGNYSYDDVKCYLVMELFHVSEEYYRYYHSLLLQNTTQLDVYSEPVQIYSNIENGMGIFAGASVDMQFVELLKE